MPLYEYACPKCHAHTDEFRSVAERNDAPECCGEKMKKLIGGHRIIGDVSPYYDDDLETYIKSKQHRRRVMKEKDVAEKFGRGWK